jgi:hypothetical protein
MVTYFLEVYLRHDRGFSIAVRYGVKVVLPSVRRYPVSSPETQARCDWSASLDAVFHDSFSPMAATAGSVGAYNLHIRLAPMALAFPVCWYSTLSEQSLPSTTRVPR